MFGTICILRNLTVLDVLHQAVKRPVKNYIVLLLSEKVNPIVSLEKLCSILADFSYHVAWCTLVEGRKMYERYCTVFLYIRVMGGEKETDIARDQNDSLYFNNIYLYRLSKTSVSIWWNGINLRGWKVTLTHLYHWDLAMADCKMMLVQIINRWSRDDNKF